MYLKKAANPKLKVKPNKDFWELTKKVITDGLKSDDSKLKQTSYELLVLLEKGMKRKQHELQHLVLSKKEYAAVKDGGDMDDIEEETKKRNQRKRKKEQHGNLINLNADQENYQKIMMNENNNYQNHLMLMMMKEMI